MRPKVGVVAIVAAGFVLVQTTPAPVTTSHPRTRPTAAVLSRKVIGTTVGERKIRAVQIGNPAAERTVVVVGCIHGNEDAGVAVIKALKELKSPDDLNIWLIKSLNPDGRAAGTRQNGRGVDLNRNFRNKWEPIGDPWDTYYSGAKPFSERESRAARDFIRKVKPYVTIWYHQAMGLVTKLGDKHDIAIERRYARRSGLPLRRLDPLPGTATRWQNRRIAHTTAFVVELHAGSLTEQGAVRHARAVKAAARS